MKETTKKTLAGKLFFWTVSSRRYCSPPENGKNIPTIRNVVRVDTNVSIFYRPRSDVKWICYDFSKKTLSCRKFYRKRRLPATLFIFQWS